ncbi:MAG: hypothetical protein FJY11_10315 [Bacteroidetes bacterium]|nr:hypothetical protein [Bacteroidota bacterium]
MKAILLLLGFLGCSLLVAQQTRTEVLERLEQGTQVQQPLKGVTKGALRLFGEKDDLTSVIIIVPNGSEVEVLERDSAYVLAKYNEYTGYLVAGKVEIKSVANQVQQEAVRQEVQQQQQLQQTRQETQDYRINPENRLTYLEHKYGRDVANRIYAGKIWKGMTPDMVKDAWGEPDRVNRVASGSTVKEEWIYRSTWLLMEQGKLKEWGAIPARR